MPRPWTPFHSVRARSFEELSKTVVGQDEAIRELSVAIVKHLVGHPAPNILLIGNSGSGKTTLMRAVEQFLASRPELSHSANVIRINANVLAEEHQGYGRAVLGRLFANARTRPRRERSDARSAALRRARHRLHRRSRQDPRAGQRRAERARHRRAGSAAHADGERERRVRSRTA